MTWREKCRSCDFESAESIDVLEHEWAEHSIWNAREREWRDRQAAQASQDVGN